MLVNNFTVMHLQCYICICVWFLQITFSQCIDSLLVFCNAHLMLSHKNKLAVIAAHANNRLTDSLMLL